MNKVKHIGTILALLSVPALAQAQGADLDAVVSGIGTEAGTVLAAMATVAVGALGIFGLILGVRYCIRIFKAVK